MIIANTLETVEKSEETKKKLPKLTRKQQIFVNEIVGNPKQSATQAVLKAYNTTPKTATVMASENLAKPSIIAYLDEHVQLAKDKIVSLAVGAEKEEVQLKASVDILDRTLGKATQRVEMQTSNISINIDLS